MDSFIGGGSDFAAVSEHPISMIECPKCNTPVSFWRFLNYTDQKPYRCECGASLKMTGMFYAFLWAGILALPLKCFIGSGVLTGIIAFVLYLAILCWVIPKSVKVEVLDTTEEKKQ